MKDPACDIELCNVDQKGESSTESGVLEKSSTTTPKWPKVEQILNPNDHHSKRFFPRWEIIFIASSSCSVFTDPLVCYIKIFVPDNACYYWNHKLMWTILGLRSSLNLFYFMDILVFWRRWRCFDSHNNTTESFVVPWGKFLGSPRTRISKLLNGEKSLGFLQVLLRVVAALPMLQAAIIAGNYSTSSSDMDICLYLSSLQYILRAYNLYRWLHRHTNIDTPIRRLLKASLDFLPFILASHLFGALWYYFCFDRLITCWIEYAGEVGLETLDYYFYCSVYTPDNNQELNLSRLQKACAVEVSKDVPKLPYDFGIYEYGLQSGMLNSEDLLTKILQCVWWGLRNLSSFGSNLLTKFAWDEIMFSIAISISGLALFLVYLNSTLQGMREISNQLKLKKKMKATYADMIHQMRNMSRLHLDALKKVPMLEGIDEKVLRAMCEHLKHVTYGDDAYVIRQGHPLRKILFITQGTLLTYTTCNGETCVCKFLEKGDYLGEELLKWVFKFGSCSELPIFTRNVVSQSKVEAFGISPNHLKYVIVEFWWHFKKEMDVCQLEHFAASSLQTAWRRRHDLGKKTIPAVHLDKR